jgi:hypothetical protein
MFRKRIPCSSPLAASSYLWLERTIEIALLKMGNGKGSINTLPGRTSYTSMSASIARPAEEARDADVGDCVQFCAAQFSRQ